MSTRSSNILLVFASLLFIACAGQPDDVTGFDTNDVDSDSADAKADRVVSFGTFYTVTDKEKTDTQSNATQLVIRGKFEHGPMVGSYATTQLSAAEAYRASGAGTWDGTFYGMKDNGIRCFRAPCFNLDERKANSTIHNTLSDIDGPFVDAIRAEMTVAPVFVVGDNHTTRDGGRSITVNEYFTQVRTANQASCTADSDCVVTAYDHEISSASECYCAVCPSAIVNEQAAKANQASWETYCSGVRLICPFACIKPPTPTCAAGTCQAL
jgi:hypothetical protein